ncbi:uncharacterized protein EV422DRAFT_535090 [Fimicolochytrium jonesii]|uniref:uncharacterized protein n=1 Tax=Fimicolochytrium jonesii TaxID=1396493 RepID=UPI0022FEC435|nr:uncharacterized protein EV422DRAFT_535090 [Fimicolochytrium jonesii]KAI8819094.1 hypothetical protein EV422DRAFT_535090 [Fimicolochytrium jonesii]
MMSSSTAPPAPQRTPSPCNGPANTRPPPTSARPRPWTMPRGPAVEQPKETFGEWIAARHAKARRPKSPPPTAHEITRGFQMNTEADLEDRSDASPPRQQYRRSTIAALMPNTQPPKIEAQASPPLRSQTDVGRPTPSRPDEAAAVTNPSTPFVLAPESPLIQLSTSRSNVNAANEQVSSNAPRSGPRFAQRVGNEVSSPFLDAPRSGSRFAQRVANEVASPFVDALRSGSRFAPRVDQMIAPSAEILASVNALDVDDGGNSGRPETPPSPTPLRQHASPAQPHSLNPETNKSETTNSNTANVEPVPATYEEALQKIRKQQRKILNLEASRSRVARYVKAKEEEAEKIEHFANLERSWAAQDADEDWRMIEELKAEKSAMQQELDALKEAHKSLEEMYLAKSSHEENGPVVGTGVTVASQTMYEGHQETELKQHGEKDIVAENIHLKNELASLEDKYQTVLQSERESLARILSLTEERAQSDQTLSAVQHSLTALQQLHTDLQHQHSTLLQSHTTLQDHHTALLQTHADLILIKDALLLDRDTLRAQQDRELEGWRSSLGGLQKRIMGQQEEIEELRKGYDESIEMSMRELMGVEDEKESAMVGGDVLGHLQDEGEPKSISKEASPPHEPTDLTHPLRSELTTLRQHLTTTTEQLTHLQTENADLHFVQATQRDSIDSLTEKLAHASSEQTRLRAQRDHFREEVSCYKTHLVEAVKRVDRLAAEIDELRGGGNKSAVDEEDLRRREAMWTRERSVLADENKGLRTQVDTLRSQVERCEGELRGFRARVRNGGGRGTGRGNSGAAVVGEQDRRMRMSLPLGVLQGRGGDLGGMRGGDERGAAGHIGDV